MNVLEVQGLTKRYPAFTLNGVSFDVPQGAVMGFIGRNGAGTVSYTHLDVYKRQHRGCRRCRGQYERRQYP